MPSLTITGEKNILIRDQGPVFRHKLRLYRGVIDVSAPKQDGIGHLETAKEKINRQINVLVIS